MISDSLKGLFIHFSVMLVVGLGTTLGFFYVYLPSETNHGETITVPNLVERNYNELEEMLLQRNLRFEVSDSVYLSTYPPLTILRQYPKAGNKVKEGRKIFITLNRANIPKISLPQLKDKSLTHVKAVLNNMDLQIKAIERKSSPYFNLVLEATYNGEPVDEGTLVPVGSSLVLYVGTGYGNRSFEMPDLFGIEYDEALVVTNALDINIEPLNIKPGIDTAGQVLYVVRQEPIPAAVINIGEWVKLWLDIKIDSSFYRQIHSDTIAENPTVNDNTPLPDSNN